jgi:capsular exopolysaccharide synthesis family protein
MVYRRQLIANEKFKSSIAEAYRAFRTNLQHAKTDGALKSILFTSSSSGEGKSITAANTAIALAQGGAKVIVLDCDLHSPVQHLIFGRIATGITNILMGQGTVVDYVQNTDISNLKILASGPIPPNPSELLNSNKLVAMLATLGKQADYLIIDTPPVLAVTDTCVLASKVDGIIIVIGAGVVRPAQAQEAREALARANGSILGIIVNRVKSDGLLGDDVRYCDYRGRVKKTRN